MPGTDIARKKNSLKDLGPNGKLPVFMPIPVVLPTLFIDASECLQAWLFHFRLLTPHNHNCRIYVYFFGGFVMRWIAAGIIFFVFSAPAYVSAKAGSAGSETCRKVNMGSDGAPDWQLMCKTSSGKVTLAPIPQPVLKRSAAVTAPDHFTITYDGTYRMASVKTGRAARGFNLGGVLRTAIRGGDIGRVAADSAITSATSGTPDKVTESAGGLTMTLEINGNTVKGQYRGTGRLRASTVNGTRESGICRLPDINGTWVGPCDVKGFTGRFEPFENAKDKSTISFDTTATTVIDVAEKERAAKEIAARSAKEKADEDADVDALIKSAPRKK